MLELLELALADTRGLDARTASRAHVAVRLAGCARHRDGPPHGRARRSTSVARAARDRRTRRAGASRSGPRAPPGACACVGAGSERPTAASTCLTAAALEPRSSRSTSTAARPAPTWGAVARPVRRTPTRRAQRCPARGRSTTFASSPYANRRGRAPRRPLRDMRVASAGGRRASRSRCALVRGDGLRASPDQRPPAPSPRPPPAARRLERRRRAAALTADGPSRASPHPQPSRRLESRVAVRRWPTLARHVRTRRTLGRGSASSAGGARRESFAVASRLDGTLPYVGSARQRCARRANAGSYELSGRQSAAVVARQSSVAPPTRGRHAGRRDGAADRAVRRPSHASGGPRLRRLLAVRRLGRRPPPAPRRRSARASPDRRPATASSSSASAASPRRSRARTRLAKTWYAGTASSDARRRRHAASASYMAGSPSVGGGGRAEAAARGRGTACAARRLRRAVGRPATPLQHAEQLVAEPREPCRAEAVDRRELGRRSRAAARAARRSCGRGRSRTAGPRPPAHARGASAGAPRPQATRCAAPARPAPPRPARAPPRRRAPPGTGSAAATT